MQDKKLIKYFELIIDNYKNENKIIQQLETIEGCSISNFVPEIDLLTKRKEWLYKNGLTKALNEGISVEWISSKGDTEGTIISHIHQFLDKVIVSDSLIVIDPYFFSYTPNKDYIDFVSKILSKYIPSLRQITLVTSDKVNAKIKQDLLSSLTNINMSLIINCEETNDFHDRFWIGSPTKGVFIGTSLNGLGKKYCLVDYIQEPDVLNILTILKDLGLII